jgi:hypothetical protein
LNRGHRHDGEFLLRSKLPYFGLVVLLIGAVCIVVGEVNLANVKTVQVGLQYSVWSYARNLTSGRTYGVDIASSQDWGVPFASGSFTSAQPVNATITSPEGDVTRLQAFYWGEPATGYFKMGTPPTIVEVEYLNVDDAGLTVDYFSSQIRFTVKQSGPYTVSVLQEGLWSKQPPDYILFFEMVAPNRETYTLLASGGGVVGTVGGITFIVSLFRSRDTKRRRTHR